MPIDCQKTSIISKTQCSHVIFFFFLWKTPAFMHIFDHNNFQFCQHSHGPKKSIRCSFFPIFHEKLIALMPIFFQKKRPFSKKHNVLIPIFNHKIVHSLKNTVLSCHFFNFFSKNQLLLCLYLVKKLSILSKLH